MSEQQWEDKVLYETHSRGPESYNNKLCYQAKIWFRKNGRYFEATAYAETRSNHLQLNLMTWCRDRSSWATVIGTVRIPFTVNEEKEEFEKWVYQVLPSAIEIIDGD